MTSPTGSRSPPKDLTAQIELHSELRDIVGEGSFSLVRRGTWTDSTGTKRTVAVKIIRPSSNEDLENEKEVIERRLNRESRLWQTIDHPYVLKFLGIYKGRDQSLSAMISPFCPLGNITTFLNVNGRDVDRPLMIYRISEGLEYLHSKNIVHGDLKGNNVLIKEGEIPLLGDFGRSRLLDSSGYTTGFTGATRYLAPELLAPLDVKTDQNSFKPELTKASDVYGFGMLGLEILTGKKPFASVRQDTVIVVIVTGGGKPPRPSLSEHYSKTWEVLDQCWERQPASRPEMSAIVQAMAGRITRG